MQVSAQLHAAVVFPKGQKHLVLGGSRTGLEALEKSKICLGVLEKSKICSLSGNEPRFFGRLTRSLDAVNATLSRLL